MRNAFRQLAVGFFLAASIAAGAARADPSMDKLYSAAKQEGAVVMYTSVPVFVLDRWKALFEKTYPGVPLTFFRSGTGKVLARIESEAHAGKVGADLVWLADETTLAGLLKAGLLDSYKSPEWDQIKLPKGPGSHYVPGRVLLGLLFVNNSLPNPPKRLADLVKPEYKGKIALASPLVSGSMNIMVAEIVKDPRFGWPFFEKLKANDALVLNDVPDVARSVASGERAVGLTLAQYRFQPEFKDSPLKMVIPEEGGLLITSPLGIIKGSPHPNAARLLERFLISEGAQSVLTEVGIYPVRANAEPPTGLPKLGTFKTINPDPEWTIAHQAEMTQKWRQLFGH
jgi:iron(III) transport system substrate-binding protein